MAECRLDKLVGLSDNEDPCFDTGRPADYNQSDSGFFITDPEYGFPIFAAIEEGKTAQFPSVWDMLDKMRDKGILSMQEALLSEIRSLYDLGYTPYSGNIGNLYGSTQELKIKPLSGLKIVPRNIKDAYLVITGIYVGLNQAITDLPVTISSSDPNFTPVVAGQVTTVGGQFTKLDLSGSPISLPFYRDSLQGSQRAEYFITVSPPDGVRFLRNKLFCCGSNPKWQRSISAVGFAEDAIPEPSDYQSISTGGSSWGIALEAYIECKSSEWLCRIDKEVSVEVQQSIARAIQTSAASKVAQHILKTPNISRYLTWNREEIGSIYQGLKDVFADKISFIAANYPYDTTGCYKCKNAANYQVKKMLI